MEFLIDLVWVLFIFIITLVIYFGVGVGFTAVWFYFRQWRPYSRMMDQMLYERVMEQQRNHNRALEQQRRMQRGRLTRLR